MRQPFFTSILLCLLCLHVNIYGKDPAMKQAKEDAKKLAKPARSDLQKNLLSGSLGFSEQDLLPDSDKGKTFDEKDANSDFKQAAAHANSSDLFQFIQSTKKKEQLDENEEFLMKGHKIAQNPHLALDLSSITTSYSTEEKNLVTCQEEGTYQRSINQTLLVQATLDQKQAIKHCLGHEHIKKYDTEKKAKHHVTTKREEFKKDSDIQSFEVHRSNLEVTSNWTHQDDVGSCDHYSTSEKTLQAGTEVDEWETDNAEILRSIESTPSCKLLYTTQLKAPETRMINGKSIFREAWARQLHFSCEASTDSKCAQLRAQGAVFVGKKCLISNVFDECDLWEKTYDLGKKGSFQQTGASFNKDELWGLSSEFDTSYDKNNDFGQVLTTLSVFSELEKTMEDQNTDFHDNVQIFKGEDLKCQKSFVAGHVFDCCKDMKGLAVDVKLASCKSEEQCLAKHRQSGKCRFIGTQKIKLGTVTEHVYCCFPSKLARVLHEQGRKQLGIKWGRADKPKCRGFSLEELQKIDFSILDLSEVVSDIKVDKEAFARKLKQNIKPLQAKVQAQIEKKRSEPVNKPTQSEVLSEIVEEKNDQN